MAKYKSTEQQGEINKLTIYGIDKTISKDKRSK